MPNRRRGAATRPIMVDDRGPEGVDSVHHALGPDVYVIHLGAGLPAAARAAGSRELNVPAPLLERLAWAVGVALEHDEAA